MTSKKQKFLEMMSILQNKFLKWLYDLLDKYKLYYSNEKRTKKRIIKDIEDYMDFWEILNPTTEKEYTIKELKAKSFNDLVILWENILNEIAKELKIEINEDDAEE